MRCVGPFVQPRSIAVARATPSCLVRGWVRNVPIVWCLEWTLVTGSVHGALHGPAHSAVHNVRPLRHNEVRAQ